jgi:hypothetical protein
MDEFKTDEASAASPRWTGAPSIPLAHQLNEQCVELVCELANNPSAQELPPFILENRDLLRLLEPDARKRVAALPIRHRRSSLQGRRTVAAGQRRTPDDSRRCHALQRRSAETL